MTSKIQRGDRVRVTFEATVQFAGSAGIDFQANENGAKPRSLLYNDGYENVVVEKVEPPRKTTLEQYKDLGVGAKFYVIGTQWGGSDEIRIKINDEKYFNVKTDKVIDVVPGNVVYNRYGYDYNIEEVN